MTILTRAWLVGACLIGLVGCSTAPEATPAPSPPAAATQAPASLEAYYDQELDWSSCEGGAECAQLTVPIDYADPSAGDTTVALLRTTGSKPLGSLVVNPGGPGGSGVDYARAAGQIFSADVTDNYQIVGFDPRGVGRSAPVDCLTDKQLDKWIALDGDPDSAAAEADLVAAAKRFGARCLRNTGDLLAHVDTASVVRDLDVLRGALREPRLNFLGFSYGSRIGALYAEDFGPTTGRMVLDGILAPQLSADEVGLGQAKGFDDALRRYVEDCQKSSDCPVAADSVADGVALVQDFLADLETKPLPTDSDQELNQSLGLGAVLYNLYFPFSGDWENLSDGLRDAFAGDGSTLLTQYRTRLERDPDGRYRTNAQEAFFAVNCLDRASEPTIEELRARADSWAQEAPVFGRYLAWSEAACAQWPEEPVGGPRQVTGSQAGPILVIGNTHDPATPLEWAQALTDHMADAHLVVWESDGHTAYGNGSTCVDDAVDGYLLQGELPADNPLLCS